MVRYPQLLSRVVLQSVKLGHIWFWNIADLWKCTEMPLDEQLLLFNLLLLEWAGQRLGDKLSVACVKWMVLDVIFNKWLLYFFFMIHSRQCMVDFLESFMKKKSIQQLFCKRKICKGSFSVPYVQKEMRQFHTSSLPTYFRLKYDILNCSNDIILQVIHWHPYEAM